MKNFRSEKILLFVKRNSLVIVIVLSMLFIESFVVSYKNEKLIEFENIKKEMAEVENLINNPNKLKFISEHLFFGNSSDFNEFVKKIGDENFAQIKSIEITSKSDFCSIKKETTHITGIFWHETFIFKFLENLQTFQPGFLKIISIDVEKFAKINALKPAMKMDVICEIYQK